MKAYLDIVQNVLDYGKEKQPVRVENGQTKKVTPTIGLPNVVFSHDMNDGFPLLTTKKMAFRTLCVELEGFIKGVTDKRWYQERGCKIWNEWANPTIITQRVKDYTYHAEPSQDLIHQWQKEEVDLGPLGYSHGWRNFGGDRQPIPHAKLADNHEPISVLGIASLGDKKYNKTVPHWQKLRKSWQQMLRRCYATNDKDYPNYGGRCVYVHNDWLIFSNYLRDIQNLDNWDRKLQNWNEYSLDKDIKGGKCYSKETCVWASNKEQVQNSIQIDQFRAWNDNEEHWFNSIQKAVDAGYTHSSIIKCCNGTQMTHKNLYWERLRNRKNDYRKGYDQLAEIAHKLRTNPYDRRMVCSAWNPNDLYQVALPSCHFAWNVCVYGDELNLFWAQRSCDLMLGVPFNVASYGLLLLLLAKHANLRPGNLTGMLVDCHIYTNQIEAAREQLIREPRGLPRLIIEDTTTEDLGYRFNIFDWTYENVQLEHYNPYPKLSFPLTV